MYQEFNQASWEDIVAKVRNKRIESYRKELFDVMGRASPALTLRYATLYWGILGYFEAIATDNVFVMRQAARELAIILLHIASTGNPDEETQNKINELCSVLALIQLRAEGYIPPEQDIGLLLVRDKLKN